MKPVSVIRQIEYLGEPLFLVPEFTRVEVDPGYVDDNWQCRGCCFIDSLDGPCHHRQVVGCTTSSGNAICIRDLEERQVFLVTRKLTT